MKLLLDQNLSPRLVARLADAFSGSSHVSLLGLDRADDGEVWSYARDNGFVIVTKDADFGDLSTLRGFPPSIVWLRMGNCVTNKVEAILRANREVIEELERSPGVVSLF